MSIANMTAKELKAAYKAKLAQAADEPSAHRLLNTVLDKLRLKNDAALARCLHLSPASISRFRSGDKPVSDLAIIRIHECTGMAVAKIKQLAGIPRFDVQ